MKFLTWRVIAVALAVLAVGMSGCHKTPARPAMTKANFGYPGMKLGPGYYAMMKKVHANEAAQARRGPPQPGNAHAAP